MTNGGSRTTRASPTSADACIERVVTTYLDPRRDDALEIAEYLLAEQPELRGRSEHDDFAFDRGLLEETRASVAANVDAILRGLQDGVDVELLPLPAAAAEWARSMVRRGVDLAAVLRAYRLGHAALWSRLQAAVHEWTDVHVDVRAVALERSSEYMFAYIDHASAAVAQEFAAERERWVRSAAAVRAEVAQRLLSGEEVDVDGCSRSLGYELRRHHVALLLWVDAPAGEAPGPIEACATRLAKAVGARDPLLIPAGKGVLWAWLGSHEPIDPDALEVLGPKDVRSGVRVAVGECSQGPQGFVTSHADAQQARRIAIISERPAGTVIRYRSIALASLLCADRERATRFVADELGRLAARDDATTRLRSTLAIYLDEGASHVRAARRLHIHQNTVAYRVHRAEELLGRPVGQRRRELEAALLASRILHR